MAAASDPEDPDALALLYVQQFLYERGWTAALAAVEAASGRRFCPQTPARGSELLELVYAQLESRLDGDDHEEATTTTAAASTTDTQQQKQQRARLAEELQLRSGGGGGELVLDARLQQPGGANPLCLQLWPSQRMVVVGAANSSMTLMAWPDTAAAAAGAEGGGEAQQADVYWTRLLAGAGGVLCVALHPRIQRGELTFEQCAAGSEAAAATPWLLASCMDGSVNVLHTASGELLASARPHSKYVVSAAWAPCLLQQQLQQHLIATASWDSSCCVLGLTRQPGEQWTLQELQRVPLAGYVQDVCWLPPAVPAAAAAAAAAEAADGASGATAAVPSLQLVVASRGTNSLAVLEVASAGDGGACTLGVQAHVNLSERDDDHVSFCAMRLALSPCSRYLLVATDSPLLLVLRVDGWGVVRRMYGTAPHDKYGASTVSIAWHRSSSYVYVAGTPDACVHVFHVGTAKELERARISGHRINVRALSSDVAPSRVCGRLATCSFDKTLRVYAEQHDIDDA